MNFSTTLFHIPILPIKYKLIMCKHSYYMINDVRVGEFLLILSSIEKLKWFINLVGFTTLHLLQI